MAKREGTDEDGRKLPSYGEGTPVRVTRSKRVPIGSTGKIIRVVPNYRFTVEYVVKIGRREHWMEERQLEPLAYEPTFINKLLRRV